MSEYNTNREQAKQRACEIKAEGYSVTEVIPLLISEGYRRGDKRGYLKPYLEYTVRKWTKGIARQNGHRNPRLMSAKERRAKQADYEKRWRAENAEYVKAYADWYRKNFKNEIPVNTERPYLGDYR